VVRTPYNILLDIKYFLSIVEMAKFKGRKKDEYLASKQFFIPLQLNRFPSIFLRIIYPLFAFQMKDYRLDLF